MDDAVGMSRDFKIEIKVDKEYWTLTVSDNGIGMKEDLENNLGVIASSSYKFKQVGDDAKDTDVIGSSAWASTPPYGGGPHHRGRREVRHRCRLMWQPGRRPAPPNAMGCRARTSCTSRRTPMRSSEFLESCGSKSWCGSIPTTSISHPNGGPKTRRKEGSP